MNTPLTPAAIEQAITQHLEMLEAANETLLELDTAYHDLLADYDVAYSKAVLAADGRNAEARKAEAVVASEDARRRADDSKVMRDHAKRKVSNIAEAIGALRTLAANSRGIA